MKTGEFQPELRPIVTVAAVTAAVCEDGMPPVPTKSLKSNFLYFTK
jgi:hypothetical protein